jgi:hypothetical protein
MANSNATIIPETVFPNKSHLLLTQLIRSNKRLATPTLALVVVARYLVPLLGVEVGW